MSKYFLIRCSFTEQLPNRAMKKLHHRRYAQGNVSSHYPHAHYMYSGQGWSVRIVITGGAAGNWGITPYTNRKHGSKTSIHHITSSAIPPVTLVRFPCDMYCFRPERPAGLWGILTLSEATPLSWNCPCLNSRQLANFVGILRYLVWLWKSRWLRLNRPHGA